MKATSSFLRILTLILSIGVLVLFFFNFAVFTTDTGKAAATGATLAFGTNIKLNGETVNLAKSAKLMFVMILSTIAAISAGLTFKFGKARYFQVGFSLGTAIYFLVYAVRGVSNPAAYIDKRPLENVTVIRITPVVPVIVALLFLSALCGIAYTLVSDYIECSKKGTLTIPRRVVRFFREYKSEIKKIVWPGPKSVVKNTVVVLIMCLLVGAFVWLLDFGLGSLIDLILGI